MPRPAKGDDEPADDEMLDPSSTPAATPFSHDPGS
jgi:hypothetical protein